MSTISTVILNCFPSEETSFCSADSIKTDPGIYTQSYDILVKYLHLIEASGLPLDELYVKPGCPLILLQTLPLHEVYAMALAFY